jgi:hypothetical protein
MRTIQSKEKRFDKTKDEVALLTCFVVDYDHSVLSTTLPKVVSVSVSRIINSYSIEMF